MRAIYKVQWPDGTQDTISEPCRITAAGLEVQGRYGWTAATGSLEPDFVQCDKGEAKAVAGAIVQAAMNGASDILSKLEGGR